jgi:hypothetical protein
VPFCGHLKASRVVVVAVVVVVVVVVVWHGVG